MPHLQKLFAATLVISLAFIAGQAKAASLPVTSGLATQAGASLALPVEKVHRRYRYWGWGSPLQLLVRRTAVLLPPLLLRLRLSPVLRVQVLGPALLPLLVVSREA
jgi:hypothetical protein